MTPIPGKLYRARYSSAHNHLHDTGRSTMARIGSLLLFLGIKVRTHGAPGASPQFKCVFLAGDGSIIYSWLSDSFMLIEELQEQP